MAALSQEEIDSIKTNIKQYIIDNFLFGNNFDTLKDNDSFLETGIIDSTGILELITFVEDNYNIKIDDTELVPENLDSINNIKAFIIRKSS